MARPKLPEGAQQEEEIWTRVTVEMKEKFHAACELEGVTTAGSIRNHIHNLVYKWERQDPERLNQSLEVYKRKKNMRSRSRKAMSKSTSDK
jgi:hypothetical protein